MPKHPPRQAQAAAAARVGYGPIMLHRVGEYTAVSIEIGGRWIEIIREYHADNFNHTIYPLGIEELLTEHRPPAPAPRSTRRPARPLSRASRA